MPTRFQIPPRSKTRVPPAASDPDSRGSSPIPPGFAGQLVGHLMAAKNAALNRPPWKSSTLNRRPRTGDRIRAPGKRFA